MTKNKLTLLFLLISFLPSIGQETLTLEQALTRALQHNFQIKISALEAEKANVQHTKGNAGMLPSVDIRIGQQQTLQEQNNPNSVLQGQIFTATTAPTLELNWLLFNGFSAQANLRKLNRLVELSENNAELVIQNTLQATALAYYKYKVEETKLEALQQTLNISKLNTERTKKKQALGILSSFDALQDLNNYYTDSSNFISQQQNLEASIRNLKLLLVDSSNTSFQLNDIPSITTNLSLDSLLQTIKKTPTITSFLLNQTILKENEAIAKSNLYPSLSMNLGSSLNSIYVRTDQFNVRPTPSWQSYINFSLNFNLFNGGKTKIAIKNAQQDQRIQTHKTRIPSKARNCSPFSFCPAAAPICAPITPPTIKIKANTTSTVWLVVD